MLISPIHLLVLATALDLEGHASAAVLSHCGIGSLAQLDEGGWVPLSLYEHLVMASLAHTQAADLGFMAGTSMANQRHGPLPQLAVHMPTLRQGLDDIIRFTPLYQDRPEIALREGHDSARIIIHPILADGLAGMFRVEFIASALTLMLRYAGANTTALSGAHFTHTAPAHVATYHRHFECTLSFESAENALVFNRDILDRPIAWHDKAAYLDCKTKAEWLLSSTQRHVDIVQRVRNVLLDAFADAPSMDEVAARLGMSKRSLRRHLADRGTSHSELLKSCRELIAEHRLADEGVALKQIADELGFSSVTSFHRAFKCWKGMTPLAWRAQSARAPG